jgi:hypothetical protein
MNLTLTSSRGHAKISVAIRNAIDAWKANKVDKTEAFIGALHASGYSLEVLPAEDAATEE